MWQKAVAGSKWQVAGCRLWYMAKGCMAVPKNPLLYGAKFSISMGVLVTKAVELFLLAVEACYSI